MSYQADFNRILDRLYKQRTDRLRHLLTNNPSRLHALTKKRRNHEIRELQKIASNALAREMAKKRFAEELRRKKPWHIRGWGVTEKLRNFRAWLKEHRSKRGKVYVFWRGHKCRYVGRTLGRGSRLSSHFEKRWFSGASRIDVYFFKNKKSVPSMECLAIHRFQPAKNKIRAARKKGASKCPLCKASRMIRKELHQIYRFR